VKKVLITGASRGIGLAIAKKLYPEYSLILHASKQESFSFSFEGSHILCADFSVHEDLNAFCSRLKREHSDLYAVVNNAGITFDKSLIFQPEQEIDKMISVNLKAPIMICKTAMKLFSLNKHGVIINISSCVGESGNAFQSVYSATKGGLVALTKSLAKEVAELNINSTEQNTQNIRAISISPGFIETDMTDEIPELVKEKYLKMIPSKRFGKPNDIANLVSFLISEKASYINGTNIHIDGGL